MLPAFVFHGIPVVSLTCAVEKAAANSVLCDGSPKKTHAFGRGLISLMPVKPANNNRSLFKHRRMHLIPLRSILVSFSRCQNRGFIIQFTN